VPLENGGGQALSCEDKKAAQWDLLARHFYWKKLPVGLNAHFFTQQASFSGKK